MPARKTKAGQRSSVVLLDDEKSYVELMAQMLVENLDCDVHTFIRPLDALKNLAAIGPSVVITDYFMPQMDGIEFVRQACAIAPKAVFIMISGHDLDTLSADLSKLKRLKKRLQKPFGWRPLADAVIEVWPGKDVPSLLEEAGGVSPR